MKKFLKMIVNKTITICAIVIILLALGIVAALNMNVNLLPDMNLPMATIQITYVGADASTIESEVCDPIEDGLNCISDISTITTYSMDNVGVIIASFDYDANIDDKINDINDTLSSITLPSGCSSANVSAIDLNGDAIATLALYGTDITTLTNDANSLKKNISNISGVYSVNIIGKSTKEIKISAIEGLDIANLLIVQALSTEGLDIPLGSVYENGDLIYIKNASDVTCIEDINNLPVKLTFDDNAFTKINDFKAFVKQYEGWSLSEFESNIDNAMINLFSSISVDTTNVDTSKVQNFLLNYKNVLRSVKNKYVDSDGKALKDSNGNVITYDTNDFKYIYDSLELKDLLGINVSADLIDFIKTIDFTNLISNGDNTSSLILKLSQIGKVEEVEVYDSYSKYNNSISVTLEVYSSNDANTTKIVSGIKEKMSGDYVSKVILLDDRASFISDSISNILSSIIIGGILAIVIIYLFIRKIRTSLIIAITLPLSVLVTLLCLYLMNISMNMVSLGGLAVGIGMLVDNSIVVLESILKHRDMGKDAKNASIDGTCEVVGSLFASTITNIIVFVPILFIKGMTKMIFNDLVYSIGFSMIMSLVVAITVIPSLYAFVYRKDKESVKEEKEIIKHPELKGYEKKYQNILTKILGHKAMVCIIALVVFLISIVLVFTSDIEFLPSIDKGIIEVSLTYDNKTSIEDAKNITEEVTNKIEELDDIEYIASTVGNLSALSSSPSATIRIQLKSSSKDTTDVVQDVRSKCHEVNNISKIKVTEIDGVVAEVTSSFSSLSLCIQGEDVNTLKEIISKIESKLKEKDGIVSVSDDIQSESNKIAYKIDKEKCALYGIDYSNVVSLLRVGISSYTACSIRINGANEDVIVKFDDNTLSSIDNINSIIVGYYDNKIIKLTDICTFDIVTSPTIIKKSNKLYQASIEVEAYNLTNGEVTNIMSNVSKNILADYPGYKYVESGVSSYLSDAFSGLAIVLIISFLLLYLVLACQFESLLKPFVIIMAIPFSFTGGFLALFITNTSLNVVSFVGIIMLMGVIVNAAIVMIDKIDLLVKEGMNIKEAVTYGPANRLRAILMSTLTTILALIPLSLGIGKGSELMQPLGISVFGGLLLGTIVTLVIIPCFYCIVKNVKINK